MSRDREHRADLQEAKAQAEAELIAWANDHIIGLPPSADVLEKFRVEAVRRVARALDVPEHRVTVKNLRYEGEVLAMDGFKLNLD